MTRKHMHVAVGFGSQDKWKLELEAAGLVVKEPGDADLSRVEMACVFNPPAGALSACPQLKAIQSLGAGVDFFFSADEATISTEQKNNIPMLRIVDPLMAERMATFCIWAVTNIQRKCDEYYIAQHESRWDKSIEDYKNRDNEEMRVGVMGLGVMGRKVAESLVMLGYPVNGWTRTQKKPQEFEKMKLYHGRDQLRTFAAASDIVINLLPLTPETHGILNADLFRAMPDGGSIVNVARGGHLVAADLLDALNAGALSHAVLDVFVNEPLPSTCPFWQHPKIRVFPHMSSVTDIRNGIEQIVRNRECILLRQQLPSGVLVNIKTGY